MDARVVRDRDSKSITLPVGPFQGVFFFMEELSPERMNMFVHYLSASVKTAYSSIDSLRDFEL